MLYGCLPFWCHTLFNVCNRQMIGELKSGACHCMKAGCRMIDQVVVIKIPSVCHPTQLSASVMAKTVDFDSCSSTLGPEQ
jgi:hypothetical protein